MIQACRQFIAARLQGLTLPDGNSRPYTAAEPSPTIFFQDLPRDFLKDNDYAVCCLPLIDRNKKSGRLLAKTRTLVPAVIADPLHDPPIEAAPASGTLTLQRRRFDREIVFRCLLYAPADHLWGAPGYTGLVEQFQQACAEFHHIADSDNSVIWIEPQDIAQPWDSNVELERKLERSPLGIVRVQFRGGVQTSRAIPLIPSVEFNPQIQ
jgi:hypothetical protein